MKDGKNNEVINVMTAFYRTIEVVEQSSEIVGKTWRKVSIDGRFVQAYYNEPLLIEVIQCLLKNKKVKNNYSQKALTSLVADRLITFFVRDPVNVKKHIDELLRELYDNTSEEMRVYMSIHGVSVSERVKIGAFEFIPATDYKKLGLKCATEQFEPYVNNLWRDQDYVAVSVVARESVKAQEKAYAEFQWLENAARLFVDSNFYDIGITSFNYSSVENSFVTFNNGMICGITSRMKGAHENLPFASVFAPNNVLYRVVSELGRKETELTELQQRMRHAVYLGGLSVHETVPEVAYFLAVSALEALFQIDKNKFLSPSIANQIIEAFCFLVAKENDRRRVFEQMRPIYGKRSAVAHGGQLTVTNDDVRLIRDYLRAAILKFIDDPVLSNLVSIDDVAAIVCDKKFGAKGFEV